MRAPTLEQGPVSNPALMRFQRTNDEMTGHHGLGRCPDAPSLVRYGRRMEAGQQVTTRVDYTRITQDKTLAVNAEDMGTELEEMFWYNLRTAIKPITFNRFWYPGWRAYLLDGKHGRPMQG